MASYTIDPTLVIRATANGNVRQVQWGEAVNAGQSVYLDGTSQRWLKCQADDAAKPQTTEQLGFALSSGLANQSGSVAVGNLNVIDVGAHGGGVGEVIVNRLNGELAPAGDLAPGEFLTIAGWTTSPTQIQLLPNVTGTAGA